MKCMNKAIRADVLENEIWDDLKAFINNPITIKDFLHQKLSRVSRIDTDEELNSINRKLDKIKKDRSKLVKLITASNNYLEKDIKVEIAKIKNEESKLLEKKKYYEDISRKEEFEKRKANIVGQWPIEGYDFYESEGVKGDHFFGLALDEDNQEELTDERIKKWIEIIKKGKDYLVWRYGVLLKDNNGSIALVREDDKTNYISKLRETLNDIFKSYKSDKPELQYRIERFGQIPDEFEAKNPVWLRDRKIINYSEENIPYYEDITGQHIDLHYTVKNYNITTENLMLEGRENKLITDKSTSTTLNFYNCNIGLQTNLNDLAQLLTENGNKEEAKELYNAASALELAEKCKSPQEVKKKGIANKLKRLADELGDEDSRLHQTVKKVKHGIGIAQEIAKGYNDIAQWAGLPQVPRPFLGN